MFYRFRRSERLGPATRLCVLRSQDETNLLAVRALPDRARISVQCSCAAPCLFNVWQLDINQGRR